MEIMKAPTFSVHQNPPAAGLDNYSVLMHPPQGGAYPILDGFFNKEAADEAANDLNNAVKGITKVLTDNYGDNRTSDLVTFTFDFQ